MFSDFLHSKIGAEFCESQKMHNFGERTGTFFLLKDIRNLLTTRFFRIPAM